MKLVRYGAAGKEQPGVLINDEIREVSAYFKDYDEDFFGSNGLERLREIIAKEELPKAGTGHRLGAPIARPSKIVCAGLNYRDHALETHSPIPKEPILFFKATSAIVGPHDALIIPKNSFKTDWEVELAVVIGHKATYVEEHEAMSYVAGYLMLNDYSERSFQMERGGQWMKGKSCDTFAPLGPFLATAEEIADVHQLDLWLKVNGTIMQNSNTANLIFNIPFLVSYISQFMTLLPGDVIATGTPAGVGLGQKPSPRFLRAGDEVEYGITGLGIAKQQVKDHQDR